MKHHLFRKYVWLIDTIWQNKGISFEEISDHWLRSPLNPEGSPLALRTFHNHRNAIENLFGIRIVCNRSNRNSYHIEGYPDSSGTRMKVWMVTSLGSAFPGGEIRDLSGRILPDYSSTSSFIIDSIVECIRKSLIAKVIYSTPTSDGKTFLLIAPYAIAQWRHQWFLIGKDSQTGIIHALDLDRVVDVTCGEDHFEFPAHFNPTEFLSRFYGMDIVADATPETVRLKIKGITRDEVRTLPLHPSQKEVVTNHEYSVFEYHIVPSRKFIATVLSHGGDSEVLHPYALREKVAAIIDSLYHRYH